MMFNLNRYAKHRTCTHEHRNAIYELKNQFVRMRHEQGLADRIYKHVLRFDQKICFRCGGTGIDRWYDDECDHCDGNGVYEEARTLEFVVFSFLVDETRYTWHQPIELVDWPYQFDSFPNGARVPGLEKPVELKPTQFAEAEDLIRFTLQLARDESPESTPAHSSEATNE